MVTNHSDWEKEYTMDTHQRNTHTTRRSGSAPAWRTVMNLEQSRWQRTAQQHRNVLPANLAALADADHMSHRDAQRLAAHCAANALPLAQAGRR